MKNIYALFICMVLSCLSILAKNIPSDKTTIKGKLENGLTYYIRQNKYPKGKVYLRLVVNAGSALESEKQRGLAHFLEHLAFSGTRDFPGKQLIDTLQDVGVRFGKELNAYTSFDETIYYLPIASEKIDLGMKVVSNWAFHLMMTDNAIERERNVIMEEKRLSSSSHKRLQEQYLPVLFDGSPYSKRFPIGVDEVIMYCDYDEIRNFYKAWYRPELMSVMIVGDIDTETAKRLLHKYFDITVNKSPKVTRPSYYPIINKDLKVVIAKDKERRNCTVELVCKHKHHNRITQNDYRVNILNKLFSMMVDNRLKEYCDTTILNISDAEISYSTYFRFIDTYSLFANCDLNEVEATFRLLLDEQSRIMKYGFSDYELQKAKSSLLASYKRWYDERNKTLSEDYLDTYQSSFLNGENEPGIEWEYDYMKRTLPYIKVNDVNSLSLKYLTKEQCVVVITGPESEAYPNIEKLKKYVMDIPKAKVNPYIPTKSVDKLMSFLPKKGKVVKEETFMPYNLIKWELSNGLTVFVKKTDYQDNQILYRATSEGGYSNIDDKDVMSAVNATRIQDESGVNNINNIQLKSLMGNKNIAITQSIAPYYESMWGKCGKEELSDLMKLIYLYHTAPYFNSKVATKMINRSKSDYSMLKKTPDSKFNFCVDSIMNGGNFRLSPWPLKKELEQVDCGKAEDIYKQRFSNAAGFTYIFVGNVDIEKLKVYVENYIASLPCDYKSKEGIKKWLPNPTKHDTTYIFRFNDENKSTVKIRYRKYGDFSRKDALNFDAFIDILNTRLYNVLRMEMSCVYGVSISGGINLIPNNDVTLSLTFGCDPKLAKMLLERTKQEMRTLLSEGPDETEINRFIEKSNQKIVSDSHNNASILTELNKVVRMHSLPLTEKEKLNYLKGISGESIIETMHNSFSIDDCISFMLVPKDFDIE